MGEYVEGESATEISGEGHRSFAAVAVGSVTQAVTDTVPAV
jgi:hypothetical protein